MDDRAQGAVLVGLGGLSLRLAITGEALNFIQPSYVPLLAVAGVLVVLLGALGLYRAVTDDRSDADHLAVDPAAGDPAAADRAGPAQATLGDHTLPITGGLHGHAHAHGHEAAPRVAWLMALPIFAVFLIAPSPLGAFAASRQASVIIPPQATAFAPLGDPVDGAVEMGLGEYSARALYDPEEGLDGVVVRLRGFVSAVEGDRWTLTRFTIACCAADGTPIDVDVLGGPPPAAIDEWVEVEGTWLPLPGHDIGAPTAAAPLIEPTGVRPIPAPDEPYET